MISSAQVSLFDAIGEARQAPSMQLFTAIELFAGAGGLALGLEKAGFDRLSLTYSGRRGI